MSLSVSHAQLAEWARKAGPESPLHAIVKATKPKRARRKATPPPPSQGRALSIVVAMPVSVGNASGKSRQFWTVNGRRKAFWKLLDQCANAGLIPPAPVPAIGVATVTSTMYLGNRMDEDNSVIRHKWLLDWLQRRGYLHNDKLVKWGAFPTQVVKRGQEYRIELEIREP